jgi:phosphoribosylformimino-5-aminoimidazole carboxamide ribotide isomerase
MGGLAVHAIRGEREHYQPLRSSLCATSDPLEVARAFRKKLGLNEIYVADLDAIQGTDEIRHREVITALACREKMSILLDAGVSDVENAHAWLELGIHRLVIGSETLRDFNALKEFPARVDRNRLGFSIDLRGGKTLSRCPDLTAMPPMRILQHLSWSGWQEVILLNLSRVGSEEGADRTLLADARDRFPGLSLLIGGGIAGPEELIELQALGIAGVLTATALHRGTINAQHLSASINRLSKDGCPAVRRGIIRTYPKDL